MHNKIFCTLYTLKSIDYQWFFKDRISLGNSSCELRKNFQIMNPF